MVPEEGSKMNDEIGPAVGEALGALEAILIAHVSLMMARWRRGR